jgi:CDGSH-type Zn-finger protein/uncharacterized Fe-S cluster protein YjdI
MSDKEIYTFPGEKVNVSWDGRVCIHVAECGQAKGDLFVGGRQPWCQPDLVSVNDVKEVVERCPSGALVYQVKDESEPETADAENTISVIYNGPYYVRGDLDIEDATDDMPGAKCRAALCRCGLSMNKPFCDNSHEAARFQDYGAVGEQGEGLVELGGKLSISAIPDGPLIVAGNVTIIAGSGRKAWQGTNIALCRCGASANKPFCDGSHTAAGFKSK